MKYILILVCFTLSLSTYASNLYNSDFIPGGIEQFQNHQQNQQRTLKGFEVEEAQIDSAPSNHQSPPQQYQPSQYYIPPANVEPIRGYQGNGCGLFGLDCATR